MVSSYNAALAAQDREPLHQAPMHQASAIPARAIPEAAQAVSKPRRRHRNEVDKESVNVPYSHVVYVAPPQRHELDESEFAATPEEEMDKKFQGSWLARAWSHRHQIGAALASLTFFCIGLTVALILFFWFQRVHKSYYMTELHRSCASLGNHLSLDISTNLVTFADDFSGYFSTLSDVTEEAITRFTSLAQDHSHTSDGISIIPVFGREHLPTYFSQFNNVKLVDGNDTFTRLGLAAPIAFRVTFPPLHAEFLNPIGLNLFYASEYASTIRRTLNTGRPSLSLADPGSTNVLPPNVRFWIMKGVQGVPVPNFPIWVISFIIDSLRSVGLTLSSERVDGMAVRLVDNKTASEYYSSVPESPLLPLDQSVTTFDVVDRQWTLTCTATTSMRDKFRTPWSWVFLFLLIFVFLVTAEIARRAVVRFLTARGIARQVKHHEGLVASLRMYSRAIVSTVRDPLIALDAFGYLVGSNNEALHRLGIQGSNASSVHITSVLPPGCIPTSPNVDSGETVGDPIPSLAAARPLPPGSYEIGVIGRPESLFIAEATVSQLTAVKRGEVSQVLLLHDMTERIQALESLQVAKQVAREASRAKSQLLLLVSHELRNPIYVIDSLIEDPQLVLGADAVPLEKTQFIAAARIRHTTRLIADILGYLVELFADSGTTLAGQGAIGAFSPVETRPAGQRLTSIANSAIDSTRSQLDVKEIVVEKWISPEWFLRGPTQMVEETLTKVAYIIAHATRPHGQVILELLVDQRSREIRLYCRGEMWVPPQRSLQHKAPSTTPPVPAVGFRSTPRLAEQTIAPEYVDPLTHAAIFLAMNAMSAALGHNLSLWRAQYTQDYGGFDMKIPLGRVRAFRKPRLVHARSVPEPVERNDQHAQGTARDDHDNESVSIVSGDGFPIVPDSALYTSPPRPVIAPHPVYPSPISPNRFPLQTDSGITGLMAQQHCYTPPTPSESRCASPVLSPTSPPRPSSAARSTTHIVSPTQSVHAPILSRELSRRALATPAAARDNVDSPVARDTRCRRSSSLTRQTEIAPVEDPNVSTCDNADSQIPVDCGLPTRTAQSPPSTPPQDGVLDPPLLFSPLYPVSSLPLPPPARDPTAHVPTKALSPAILDPVPSFAAGSPAGLATEGANFDRAEPIPNPLSIPTIGATLPDDANGQPSVPTSTETVTNGPFTPSPEQLKRILIVEDNALVLRVTSKLVKTLGYEVETAMDGLECVKRIKDDSKPNVDLILMDLVMPNMDGMEAMTALRAEGHTKDKMPIVAVTANALPEERDKCLEAGFNDFVTKPLKKDGLLSLCSRFFL